MSKRQTVSRSSFNGDLALPYDLRMADFEMAMQDVYDFFFEVNVLLSQKGLHRLDEMMRPAAMSGIISDMLTASLAKHSRTLVENRYFNGHPDLVRRGIYPNDSVRAGEEGVEIKSTRKAGGAVDTHGARKQWMCVFVYQTDGVTQPISARQQMSFREVYIAEVVEKDFRQNARSMLGTRTATLDRNGVVKLRQGWLYKA